MTRPTVTVSVITYNSEKYVLETLESIKEQTYQNLILQICDDCSTDNTIELCKNWIDKNGDRFVKTKIIVPDSNTGVSGNFNRSWNACETEWLKDIAGDDILLSNCIEDNMNYVSLHPDAVLVFSKVVAFGASKEQCKLHEEKIFDYSFFSMTLEQQYERIKYASCLPTASQFCNLKKLRDLGICHDERIPLLEDRPKWLNSIKKGIKFHFFDIPTVKYRLHKKSLSNSGMLSPKFYESTRLAYFYYVFQNTYDNNPELAIREVIKHEVWLYNVYYKFYKYYRYYKKVISFPTRIVKHLKGYFYL